MYHYIRDLKRTRYPEIKGLDLSDFIDQVRELKNNLSFISIEQCLEYLQRPNSTKIPENAALLTFDDGYIEHYTEVFPILDDFGIQGVFFPPVCSTMNRTVLDVNKIHFILAVSSNKKRLLDCLSESITKHRKLFNLAAPEDYFQKIGEDEHPYDPYQVILFKRVLQRELPAPARSTIINELFNEFIAVKEGVFSDELYMKRKHLKIMMKYGMHIGGHGYSHQWMDKLSDEDQMEEIKMTKEFLTELGVQNDRWVMCYPFGAYDQRLVNKLKGERCAMAFTTGNVKHTTLSAFNRYELGRIDTNEV